MNNTNKQIKQISKTNNVMTCYLADVGTKFLRESDIAMTLLARDWKGMGTYCSNAVIVQTIEEE